MFIVSVVNLKGGCGKTTLATQLAARFARQRRGDEDEERDASPRRRAGDEAGRVQHDGDEAVEFEELLHAGALNGTGNRRGRRASARRAEAAPRGKSYRLAPVFPDCPGSCLEWTLRRAGREAA